MAVNMVEDVLLAYHKRMRVITSLLVLQITAASDARDKGSFLKPATVLNHSASRLTKLGRQRGSELTEAAEK
eukprot:m.294199 g.294199  ORF g.294199 m.294199 type:complete len:72 (-) comp39802_c0_seq1:170-385(-)